jgi:transcriptional regulator with XRE-family HTH domain
MGDVNDIQTGRITRGGNLLYELRCASGLTPTQLATACGVDRATIGGWEDGTLPISDGRRIKLARRFGVGGDYLMGREG